MQRAWDIADLHEIISGPLPQFPCSATGIEEFVLLKASLSAVVDKGTEAKVP